MDTGLDRNRFKPLDPDGNRYRGQLGCWGGRFAHWNVQKPRAGYQYFWANRTQSSVRRFVMMGAEVVAKEDQEFTGDDGTDRNLKAANIEPGYESRGGHVLLRIREEKLRENQKRRVEHNRHYVEGATRQFLEGINPIPEKYLQKPIRYVLGDHNPNFIEK